MHWICYQFYLLKKSIWETSDLQSRLAAAYTKQTHGILGFSFSLGIPFVPFLNWIYCFLYPMFSTCFGLSKYLEILHPWKCLLYPSLNTNLFYNRILDWNHIPLEFWRKELLNCLLLSNVDSEKPEAILISNPSHVTFFPFLEVYMFFFLSQLFWSLKIMFLVWVYVCLFFWVLRRLFKWETQVHLP